jgi:hypothetical protein
MSIESCGRLRREGHSILAGDTPVVDMTEVRGWAAGEVLADGLAALDPPATDEERAWMRGWLAGSPPVVLSRFDRAVAELTGWGPTAAEPPEGVTR